MTVSVPLAVRLSIEQCTMKEMNGIIFANKHATEIANAIVAAVVKYSSVWQHCYQTEFDTSAGCQFGSSKNEWKKNIPVRDSTR